MKRRNSVHDDKTFGVRNWVALCILLLPLTWIVCDGTTISAQEADILDLPKGTERVCLSLRVLSKQVMEVESKKARIPEELLRLSGLGYLEGFIIDEAKGKDIILVGRRSKDRPTLYLDDLIVGLRNVRSSLVYPYCSLDPRSEDTRVLQNLFQSAKSVGSPSEIRAFFQRVKSLVGPQQVVVGGVPRNSRHAHIMIDADYHMKKVSQGHIAVSDVSSYLDLFLEDAMSSGAWAHMTVSRARFWFHIGEGAPTFQESKGIVWLDKCPVVVLAEKQGSTPSGRLFDVEEHDPIALAFAKNLSDEFSNVAESFHLYADLENLFRLRALLLAMKFRNSLAKAGTYFQSFMKQYTYVHESLMDPSLPGLANYQERSHRFTSGSKVYDLYLFPIVCGGVGMDMATNERSFSESQSRRLFSFRMAALLARPSRNSLTWIVTTTE